MNTKELILQFLDKCEEMKKCKFIVATTKIKDLLKCIVNSPELYGLFESVTKDFNYPEMRAQCLSSFYDGSVRKSRIVLPQDIGQRLAFIFCLLVEFDSDSLGFNDFLLRYFPEEGSYYASYRAFCNTIIKALQDAIAKVFAAYLDDSDDEKSENTQGAESGSNSIKAELLSVLNLAISEERQYVTESNLIPEEDKEGGLRMLDSLLKAIKAEDVETIDSLICGYNYFVLYYKCVSEGVGSLIQAIAAYEEAL